jgi:hypothetical protein
MVSCLWFLVVKSSKILLLDLRREGSNRKGRRERKVTQRNTGSIFALLFALFAVNIG